MKIFSGTANSLFVSKIRCVLGDVIGDVEISKFPDGEIHVKYNDNIRGKDVFIVQSTNNPVNDNIMELLIMIDAAKRASAARITAVIPFYAYARQDRKEQPRVPITAKLVADLLTAAGANRILTMDLHSPQIQGFFNIPVDHLQAIPAFAHYLNNMRLYNSTNKIDMNNIVIVSPDVGRAKVAVQYAKRLNCPISIISKERISAEIVQSEMLIGSVNDKTAIIIDDLSTTGGTLIAAAELVKKNGAKFVIAGVTHNILTKAGIDKINESCIDKMLVTDTVDGCIYGNILTDTKFTVISVHKWFADAIYAIHNNNSVSSLF